MRFGVGFNGLRRIRRGAFGSESGGVRARVQGAGGYALDANAKRKGKAAVWRLRLLKVSYYGNPAETVFN